MGKKKLRFTSVPVPTPAAKVDPQIRAEAANGRSAEAPRPKVQQIGMRLCKFANGSCICSEKGYAKLCQGVEREAQVIMQIALTGR